MSENESRGKSKLKAKKNRSQGKREREVVNEIQLRYIFKGEGRQEEGEKNGWLTYLEAKEKNHNFLFWLATLPLKSMSSKK
jgi:hypothetical protein